MLILKRLLVIVTTLLCALSIAACSGTSGTNAQAAAANSSTSGVSTTNEIAKETTQSQANKQTTTNKQTANQSTQSKAQISTSVNNSQQVSGKTTVSKNTQSSQQNNSAQNNNAQNSNKQNTQSSQQNNNNQAANNEHQTSHNSSTQNNSNNSSGTNTFIKVTQVSINGQMTNILTTGNGMTLYYDTNDSAMNATCTGGCAQTWPPFLAQGQIITSNGITSGQVTEQATANGKQVEYNGHPLYTYANDTTAGQVNGQGVNNIWYATSAITVQAAHW
jgi:predicted lipoprotein with Yx(FWY)xxD motif